MSTTTHSTWFPSDGLEEEGGEEKEVEGEVEVGGSLEGRKIASPTMSKRKKERGQRISKDTSSVVTDIPRGHWIVQNSAVQNNTVQYSSV
jgi:hypothetical protein